MTESLQRHDIRCRVQAARIKASLDFERQSTGRHTAESAQRDLAAAQQALADLESEQEAAEEAAQEAAAALQSEVSALEDVPESFQMHAKSLQGQL